MCTLIVLHRCVPGRSLVVAANRDEFLSRPAEGLAIRETRSGRILAPLDLEAGGTWLGLNERGVFVGLTNLRPETPPGSGRDRDGGETARAADAAWAESQPVRRSRGEVVMAALESSSASEASQILSELDEGAYNPFQLLVADELDAWLTVYRDRPAIESLGAGVHVVGNVLMGEGSGPCDTEGATVGRAARDATEEPRVSKLTRVRQRVEKMITESSEDLFEGLARICREHVGDPGSVARTGEPGEDWEPFAGKKEESIAGDASAGSLEAFQDLAASALESTCVHIGARYGTRSSLLLELAQDRDLSRLWTTDGPPCQQPYEDLSPLLGKLDLRSASGAEAQHEARTNR